MVAFSRSRLKTSSAAPLTLHFLVTLFDKTFAFAILAFHFRFACILLHVFSNPEDCWWRLVEWNEIQSYSITSSAVNSSFGGTVMPSALAVFSAKRYSMATLRPSTKPV
jgi:hypothetical protein